MKPGKKVIVAVVAVTVVAWVGVSRFGNSDASETVDAATEERSVTIDRRETLVATEEMFSQRLPISGSLRPVHEAAVRSKVAAEVVAVNVREGDFVTAGSIIVKLDTADLRNMLREKENNLAGAEAQLTLLRTELANKQKVFDRNYISQFEFDSAVGSVNVQKAAVDALQNQVSLARTALDNAAVRAPFDGFISKRSVNPGEKVSVDTALLTVVDLKSLELKAGVPAASIAQVKVGQRVRFRVEGFAERRFAGEVVRINPTTEPGSGSIAIHIAVDNDDANLRGGMFANGELLLGEERSLVLLPDSAIGYADGAPYALVVRDGVLESRQLELGEQDIGSGRTALQSGVRPGDIVVTSGVEHLQSGAVVRLSSL